MNYQSTSRRGVICWRPFGVRLEAGAVLLLLLVAGPPWSRADGSRFSQPVARGVVVPFYEPAGGRPTSVLRLKVIYRDLERRGFFRIGSLPVVVVEGLCVECGHPDRLGTAFAKVRTHLSRCSGHAPVEVRGFKICSPSPGTVLLEAGRLRFEGTACEFCDGVVRHGAKGPERTDRAVWLPDKNSGMLTLRTAEGQVWTVGSTEVVSKPQTPPTP